MDQNPYALARPDDSSKRRDFDDMSKEDRAYAEQLLRGTPWGATRALPSKSYLETVYDQMLGVSPTDAPKRTSKDKAFQLDDLTPAEMGDDEDELVVTDAPTATASEKAAMREIAEAQALTASTTDALASGVRYVAGGATQMLMQRW